MAISPPSDIVLDVALAADPAKRDAAVRRLSAAVGTDGGGRFATALQASSTPPFKRAQGAEIGSIRSRADDGLDPAAKAIKGLEAFFLRTAFDRMMPESRSKVPLASGGGIWKSMLTDALATQVTASGSVSLGIKQTAAMKVIS